MVSSFYFYLSSIRMDYEGNILTLFLTLTFYSYYKSTKGKNNFWIYLTGFLAGISILFKYSSIFVLGTIFLYEFFVLKERTIKSILNRFVPILIISVLITSLFPLIV